MWVPCVLRRPFCLQGSGVGSLDGFKRVCGLVLVSGTWFVCSLLQPRLRCESQDRKSKQKPFRSKKPLISVFARKPPATSLLHLTPSSYSTRREPGKNPAALARTPEPCFLYLAESDCFRVVCRDLRSPPRTSKRFSRAWPRSQRSGPPRNPETFPREGAPLI